MTDPDRLDTRLTLRVAVARLDELRIREALGGAAGIEDPDDLVGLAPQLTRHEALELLALTEVVARKAVAGRQLSVRTALAAGATWDEVAASLGTTAQAAEDAYRRWVAGPGGPPPA